MTTQNPETITKVTASLLAYSSIEPVEAVVIRIAECLDRIKGNRTNFDKFWTIHTVIYNNYEDFDYDFAYLVAAEVFKFANRADEVDTLEG